MVLRKMTKIHQNTKLYLLRLLLWGTVQYNVTSDYDRCWKSSKLALLNCKKSPGLQNGIQPLHKPELCLCITTWPSGSLEALHTILSWCMKAPSHVTICLLPLCFPECVVGAKMGGIRKGSGERGKGGGLGVVTGGRFFLPAWYL